MDKKTTSITTTPNNVTLDEVLCREPRRRRSPEGPSQSAINFVKQFARCYHFEPSMPSTALASFIPN